MSEIVNIPLGGVSNEPNDYAHGEGDLSLSLNAVKHHGSIRPVMPGSPAEDIGTLPANTDVVAIHEVGDMKHYILVKRPEDAAGVRPSIIIMTIHYLCMPGQIKVWWTSNYDAGMDYRELRLGIGAGEYSVIEQLPYNTPTTINATQLAIREYEDSEGYMQVEKYDFFNRNKHFTDQCFTPINFANTYEPVRPPVRPGAGEFLPIGDVVDQVNYHYQNSNPTFTISCVNTPSQIGFRMSYSSMPEQPIDYLKCRIGQGTSATDIVLYPGQETYISTDFSVGVDDNGNDIMYSFPNEVVSQEVIFPIELIGNGTPYTDLINEETGQVDTAYYTFNFHIESSETEDIETPEPEDSDDAEDDIVGDYILLYHDASISGSENIVIAAFNEPIKGVTTIGNAVVVTREQQPLYYLIWKDGAYKRLGTSFPSPSCKLYLQSSVFGVTGVYAKLQVDISANDMLSLEDETHGAFLRAAMSTPLPFTPAVQTFVHNKAFAVINTVHSKMTKQGYFYAPFFVRLAYRMFDGSHIMHTPPQLMIPNSSGQPLIMLNADEPSSDNLRMAPLFVASRLHMKDVNFNENWKDLITHLDVFVSPPLISYTDAPQSIIGTTDKRTQILYERNEQELSSVIDDYRVRPSADESVLIRYYTLRQQEVLKVQPNLFSSGCTTYVCHNGRVSNLPDSMYETTSDGEPIRIYPETVLATVPDGETEIELTIEDLDIADYFKSLAGSTHGLDAFICTDADSYIKAAPGHWSTSVAIITFYNTLSRIAIGGNRLEFERTDERSYNEAITENNTYHKIASIPVDKLSQPNSINNILYDISLEHLEQKEELTDNGQMRRSTSTTINPFGYNHRLSVVVNEMTLPSTSPLTMALHPTLYEYVDGQFAPTSTIYQIDRGWVKATVNAQVVYKQIEVGGIGYIENLRHFYYPGAEASSLILQLSANDVSVPLPYQVREYTLTQHPLMDGSYLFNDFLPIEPTQQRNYASHEAMMGDESIINARQGTSKVVYGNMVRVSGVSNPFYFNEVNQVTLPTGTISGLSTTSQALSQGQFGAFPLYCFSDNGIWALEVSDTGTYSAKQPVSRAVCTNPDSITQTEGQVLFVTKRGLMALDGSSVTCLSEILSGHNYTSTLSRLDRVKKLAGLQDVPNPTHIEEWLQDARLLYDDKRQMLYAFNEEDVLGYVYSISDQAWGMMVHDLAHPLPCYTDALAVTREDTEGVRRLINMSDPAMCGPAPKALLITRPLTMGVPDGYKTLEALVTRGMLDKDDDDKDDAKLVIWASNDLKKWAIIATSKTSWYRGMSGTPYKYFRFGLILDNWEEEDSVNGFSADITPRLNNRLR